MKNIVVLVSGGGTNLQALIDAEKSGEIKGGKITSVNAFAPELEKNIYTYRFDYRFEKGLLL